MKTFEYIPVRTFPVKIQDKRSGNEMTDSISLSKATLQAAQLVGESSAEVIYRSYDRKGYRVLDIGKPLKATITVDLEREAIFALAEALIESNRHQQEDNETSTNEMITL